MRKNDFIEGLKKYLSTGKTQFKGQKAFVNFLIEYLTRLDLSAHEKYDFWHMNQYIPQIMLDAFEELRTGKDEWVLHHREQYKKETEHLVPNITDVGASNMYHQGSAIQTTLGFMLKEVMKNNYIESQVDAYCNAQKHVIQQYFDKFLREVYRKGLRDIIEKSKSSGMVGKFGKTELRAFSMAGRLAFTFARKNGKGELVTSFLMEEEDPHGYSAGLNGYNTNFIKSLNLINDVINHWPATLKEQRNAFRDNKNVAPAVVLALRALKKEKKKKKKLKKAV